jgi:hypothetical protein
MDLKLRFDEFAHWLKNHIASPDLENDDWYRREYPNFANLSDEEIEGIALKFISRVDYSEHDLHTVREHLTKLRDVARQRAGTPKQ